MAFAKHWRALTAAAAGLTTILGAAIAWQQLLPTPAWSTDIQTLNERIDAVHAFDRGTRQIVLGQERRNIMMELDSLRLRSALELDNADLRRLIRIREEELRVIEQQLRDLKK